MNNQEATGIYQRNFGTSLHNQIHLSTMTSRPLSKPVPQLCKPFSHYQDQQSVTMMDIQQPEQQPIDLCQSQKYTPQILTFLFSKPNTPISDYLQNQPQITPHMRGVLVNWIVNVHSKYEFCPETLYTCVYVIDKFLEKQSISKKQLQLLGVTALWISSKYHQVYQVPKISNLAHISDNAFTTADILVMEQRIINSMGFDFLENTLMVFIEGIIKTGFLDEKDISFAKYFAQLSLVDWSVRIKDQKLLAVGIVYLIKRMKKTVPYWTGDLVGLTGISELDAKAAAKDIYLVIHNLQSNPCFHAVRSKYSTIQNHQVGKILFKHKTQ